MTIETRQLPFDGQIYPLEIHYNNQQPLDAPRLIIPAYIPTEKASNILRVCVESVLQRTDIPCEIWVVDNNSPFRPDWLLKDKRINVVLSNQTPLPADARRWWHSIIKPSWKPAWGSYANAIGLELGVRSIHPDSQWIMTLHMDVMAVADHWLNYLLSHMTDKIRAAGVRMDTARTPEGVLHVLGYLVDFQLFKKLNLSFFPELPQYDVGDLVTVKLREAGYEVFACPNSLWQPELIDELEESSPFRELYADRTFDDRGNVIFAHMGRGVRKSADMVAKGMTPESWVQFAHDHILQSDG